MAVESALKLSELAPVIGLRIRETRTEKGLSQKDLVGERFSKSYISSIERGKITPSLKALEYIAGRLSVSLAFLLTGMQPGLSGTASRNNHAARATVEETGGSEVTPPLELLMTEARILREQGNPFQARHTLDSKIRVRQLNIEQLKQYHFLLAQICLDLQEFPTTKTELESVRDLAEKTGDLEMLARARQLLGQIYIQQHKPVLAIEQLRQALQAIDSNTIKDIHFRLDVYSQLGALHQQLGDTREAVEMYRRALHEAEEISNPRSLAAFYWNTALAHRENGQLGLARQYANKSLALYESIHNLRTLSDMQDNLGLVMLKSGGYDEAEMYFLRARELASSQQDRNAFLSATMHLADLYLEQNKLDKAQFYSDSMFRDLDDIEPVLRGHILNSRATLLAALGDNNESLNLLEEAVRLVENTPARELLSKIYFRYARALNLRGDTARAAEMFERAYRQLDHSDMIAER
ncbi:MAG TPA: tetratricopeptide repeat protein [Chloroflexia bacterium]|nr:tetratricopeptide repeat protein [Chloroflexia bacterium]